LYDDSVTNVTLTCVTGILLLEEAVRKKVTDDAAKVARAEEKAVCSSRLFTIPTILQ
jgi:hypothetical protein